MKLYEFTDLDDCKELLDKHTPDISALANKHGVDEKYLRAQLRVGIEVEHEHTSHREVAAEIALDHLNELPDYYERLDKMENQ
jgi:hypothetical protein